MKKIFFTSGLVAVLFSKAMAATVCYMTIAIQGQRPLLLQSQNDVFAGSKIQHFMLPIDGTHIEFGRLTKSGNVNQLDEVLVFPEGLEAPSAVYPYTRVNLGGLNPVKDLAKLESRTLLATRLTPSDQKLAFLKDSIATIVCQKQ